MSMRGDLLLDDGPLVHHPDPFHEDEVGAHGDEVLAVVVDGVGGVEVVVAVAPAEHLEHDLRHLDLQRVLQVLLVMALLVVRMWPRRCRVCFWTSSASSSRSRLSLPCFTSTLPRRSSSRLLGGVGHHHHAVLEGDGDALLLVVVEGQDAGLPLQADELEDVGKAEVLDRPFEGHGASRRPPARRGAPPGARATLTSKLGLAARLARHVDDASSSERGADRAPGRADSARGLGDREHAARQQSQRQDRVPGRLRSSAAQGRAAVDLARAGRDERTAAGTRARAARPPPAPRAASGCGPGPTRRRAPRTGGSTGCTAAGSPRPRWQRRQKGVPHFRQRMREGLAPAPARDQQAGDARRRPARPRSGSGSAPGRTPLGARRLALGHVLARRRPGSAPANFAQPARASRPRSTTA